jgi:hypothetical protein
MMTLSNDIHDVHVNLYTMCIMTYMCYFIVGLPLDVRFKLDLEADAAIWRINIESEK